MSSNNQGPEMKPDKVYKKKGLLPYIIALIVVIIGCVGTIAFVYNKNSGDDVEVSEIIKKMQADKEKETVDETDADELSAHRGENKNKSAEDKKSQKVSPEENTDEKDVQEGADKRETDDDSGEKDVQEGADKQKPHDDSDGKDVQAGADKQKPREEIEIKPPEFEKVFTSSALKSDGQNTYYAENIRDGRTDTAWVEGVLGDGIGECISFSTDTEQSVTGIRILNGYCKNESIYKKNSRVKKIKIVCENEEAMIFDLPDTFNQYCDVKFGKTVHSPVINIEIMEVYHGTHYTDTCISEIEIY